MHVVLRTYQDPDGRLANLVGEKEDELRSLMKGITGFVSWVAAKSGDTLITGTTCQSKEGCDQSVQVARDWVAKQNVSSSPPQVTEGEVLLRVV